MKVKGIHSHLMTCCCQFSAHKTHHSTIFKSSQELQVSDFTQKLEIFMNLIPSARGELQAFQQTAPQKTHQLSTLHPVHPLQTLFKLFRCQVLTAPSKHFGNPSCTITWPQLHHNFTKRLNFLPPAPPLSACAALQVSHRHKQVGGRREERRIHLIQREELSAPTVSCTVEQSTPPLKDCSSGQSICCRRKAA